MFKKTLIVLACTIALTAVAHAQYPLFFLQNEEFESMLSPWMTTYENGSSVMPDPGTAEWVSGNGGSAHLTVSGAPSVVGISAVVGTTIYPGDTVVARIVTTDMTGFGAASLQIGRVLNEYAPFYEDATVPDGAGTHDVALVCRYLHGPGTILSAKLVVWPGSGEAWVDYVRLLRATSYGLQEGDRAEMPTRQVPQIGRTYPSPATGPLFVCFELARPTATSVGIYDLSGALVRRLQVSGSAGTNRVAWNGADELGRGVAAGIYCYSVSVDGSSVASGKITLTR